MQGVTKRFADDFVLRSHLVSHRDLLPDFCHSYTQFRWEKSLSCLSGCTLVFVRTFSAGAGRADQAINKSCEFIRIKRIIDDSCWRDWETQFIICKTAESYRCRLLTTVQLLRPKTTLRNVNSINVYESVLFSSNWVNTPLNCFQTWTKWLCMMES